MESAAKGFIKLGLQPRHGVGILGFNAPEWFMADLATVFAGGMAAGIYPTRSTEDAIRLVASLGREDTLLCGERKGLMFTFESEWPRLHLHPEHARLPVDLQPTEVGYGDQISDS